MIYGLYHFAGAAAARLVERLPDAYRSVTLDETATPGAVSAPAVIVVDASPEQLQRALALKTTEGAVEIVVIDEAASLPLTPSEHVYAYLVNTLPAPLVAHTIANAAVHAQRRFEHERMKQHVARLSREFSHLNEIGICLSSERRTRRLLELIVSRAREITRADAGSLYLVEEDPTGQPRLRFAVVQNDTVAVPFEGAALPIGPGSVAGHVAATGQALNLEDAYVPPPGASFTIDRGYDTEIGYRTKSMLVVPLTTPDGRVTGVLQLINCKADRELRFASPEHIVREARPFPARFEELARSVASQAAVALENSRLCADLQRTLAELEASQARVVQAERLRALGEMTGGLSHDFNNTLAAILGRVQLLLMQVQDVETRRQLSLVEQAAMDGARTIRRIQEFARTRRERPYQAVEVNQLVEEVVALTRPRWKDEATARGITYDVRVETTPVPRIAGDPSELREAFTNLVLNALDAMPSGGRLTLRTHDEGDHVRCVVADTGVGMTDDVRHRIFEPFFTTKEPQGSGLGLSVMYGVVMRHGGDIEVASRPGQGSVFTIRLPATSPGAPAVPRRRGVYAAHVLVAEDEIAVRDVLEDALLAAGHRVSTCADGLSALGRIDAERFDLVVTDLGMPGASGWDVARHVKRARPGTPVVLVTGWGDQISTQALETAAVDAMISKPFAIEQVEAVVRRVLERAGRHAQRVKSGATDFTA